MKNIYKRIRVSPFFLFIIFISVISGLFRDILTLLLVLLVHELGHILLSVKLNWKISKIDITMCGGFITYDDIIDKPFNEELIVALAGFMFQIILFIASYIIFKIDIIDNKALFLINKYNVAVLLFNIIPIYPLDGSKVMLILLNILYPYKKALRLINFISIVILILILTYFIHNNAKLEYSYIIIISFIISKIISHIREVPYLFNKLLFERYIYPIKVNKYNYVNNSNINLFKRRRKNIFKVNNHYVGENVILAKKFD